MPTTTDTPEAPAPVAASPIPGETDEPVAEPSVVAEGAQLSLKVRTLDQKTYPITVCSSASVPELKERIAEETGVTQARQRLIYRGRVLKNDQLLTAYSLEDGHVLHLVARAEALTTGSGSGSSSTSASVSDSGAGGSTASASVSATHRQEDDEGLDTRLAFAELNAGHSFRAQPRGRSRRLRSPPVPRDNDEPDPTMGRSASGVPSRLLMGATISVPEGADVTMPFLSSMIANLVTQVGDGEGVEGGTGMPAGTVIDGRRHVSFSLGENPDPDAAATARVLRLHRRNRDGSGSTGRSHSRRSSTSAERQAVLRSRAGQRLDTMRATLDDASLDFPVELVALQQGDIAVGMTELQQQVVTLQTLMERFGPRLRLLPAALAQRDRLTEHHSQAAEGTVSAESTSNVELTINVEPAINIEPVMNVEPASTVEPIVNADPTANTELPLSTEPSADDTASTAVSARHVIRAIETLQTIGEAADFLARMARHAFVRQSMHLGETIPRRGSTAASGGGANTSGRVSTGTLAAFEATNSLRRVRAEARDAASARPRFRLARIRATAMPQGNVPAPTTASTASDVMPGSSSSFPVDLTGSTSSSVPPVASSDPSARNSQSSSRSQRADAPPSDEGMPPPGPHISIAGLGGLPVMSSVVFPFSLAAGLNGNHATTTWNLADFVYRLTSELPISTLYGVLGGDNTHLHHLLAHVGFALFSGVDVPRVSRPNIRTWAQDFVGELRNLLRSNALPVDVLEQIVGPTERGSALGTELISALEPFVPELVDTLVRATSASRAAAFGASSSDFLRTMARQVVSQLRAFARGDSTESADGSDSRLELLLQRLLVWLGMNEHMTDFAVDRLLRWTEDDSTASRRNHRRRREETDSSAEATDEPANKRRRGDS